MLLVHVAGMSKFDHLGVVQAHSGSRRGEASQLPRSMSRCLYYTQLSSTDHSNFQDDCGLRLSSDHVEVSVDATHNRDAITLWENRGIVDAALVAGCVLAGQCSSDATARIYYRKKAHRAGEICFCRVTCDACSLAARTGSRATCCTPISVLFLGSA